MTDLIGIPSPEVFQGLVSISQFNSLKKLFATFFSLISYESCVKVL